MTGNEPYYLVAAATAVGACLLLKAALSATVVLVSQSVVVHCSPQEVFDFLASEKSAYLQPLIVDARIIHREAKGPNKVHVVVEAQEKLSILGLFTKTITLHINKTIDSSNLEVSNSVRFPGGEGQQRFLLEAVKQVSDPAASTARDEVLLTRVTDVFEVTCPRIASAYVKSTATSAHLQLLQNLKQRLEEQ